MHRDYADDSEDDCDLDPVRGKRDLTLDESDSEEEDFQQMQAPHIDTPMVKTKTQPKKMFGETKPTKQA